MGDVSPNLEHAILNDCTDRDCELHNLDIAQREEVITNHEVAYFLAGAHALAGIILERSEYKLSDEQTIGASIAELRKRHHIGITPPPDPSPPFVTFKLTLTGENLPDTAALYQRLDAQFEYDPIDVEVEPTQEA